MAAAGPAAAAEITIATVNNGDMIVVQELAGAREKATGNTISWVVLEENVLRHRFTTDIASGGGQDDVMTIGSYKAPIWGQREWLVPLDDLGDDFADLIPAVKNGASYDGRMFAAPFYAESSFTLYRTDLFEAAGLKMPAQPTYTEIAEFAEFAEKLTDAPGVPGHRHLGRATDLGRPRRTE